MKQFIGFILMSMASMILVSCLGNEDNSGFTAEVPEISFEKSAVSVGPAAETIEIMLDSNLPWRAKSNASWAVLSKANGMKGENITISVQKNRTREERRATITAYVTSAYKAVLEIVQDAASATEVFTYYVKTDGDALASGLSWEEATTLPTAIEAAGDGDVICLAAGTYTPVALLTGGDKEEDRTFEIHSNFTMEGGYPVDASTGAVADPVQNTTVLSGRLEGTSAWHVVTVTAVPDKENTVLLKNLTISGGKGYEQNEQIRRTSGLSVIDAGLGGGIFIGRSNTRLVNCVIMDNSSCHAGGVLVYIGANVSFSNCTIRDNSAINNGGGIWNMGATVYMDNCSIDRNTSGQQCAGYYSIDSDGSPSISRIYNSTFYGNDNTRSQTKRSGGAGYIRAGSDAVFVNCTFTANKAGYGGVISVHGTSNNPSRAEFISCTMTDNSATDGGGALFSYNKDGYAVAYNSIVSGNKGPAESADAGVQDGVDTSNVQLFTSILGSSLLGADGSAVPGWTFKADVMLGTFGLYGNGFTKTFPLVQGVGNPAAGQGMGTEALKAMAGSYDPALDEVKLGTDQNGENRNGSAIGATTL